MSNSLGSLENDSLAYANKNKKFILVFLALFVLFLIGLCLNALGLFDTDPNKDKTEALGVTASKQKELSEKEFDRKDETKDWNNVEDYQTITGSLPPDQIQSNAKYTQVAYESSQEPVYTKQAINQNLQNTIHKNATQNRQLMRAETALYKPTKRELEEDRLEKTDRLNNQRQQDLILNQLEKVNANPAAVLHNNATYKPLSIKPNKPIEDIPSINKVLSIAPNIGHNTTAQISSKPSGFYNLNAKHSKQAYQDQTAIMAVIHGDGEGIKVKSGQEVKIRLLEPFRLLASDETISIPKGTLLSAFANIQADRLFLSIQHIFFNKQMYPVHISIADRDGRKGIYVPALLDAPEQSRFLNNVAQPISGTNYFAPSGTVAQQVGSSIAVNVAQNALQSTAQYLRKRTKQNSVRIYPNYKILLFNSNDNNQNTPANEID